MCAHYIKKCILCNSIIEQCRCMSKDKIVTYSVCSKCSSSNKKIEIIKNNTEIKSKKWFECPNCKKVYELDLETNENR